MTASGVAHLCALGVEAFGRWSGEALDVVHRLVDERCAGLPRYVRAPSKQRLLRRWWGLLGMAVQRAVAQILVDDFGANLVPDLAEPIFFIADWTL